jgi:uncharacterized damage-inducible protein DinB
MYLDLVPNDGQVLTHLQNNVAQVTELVRGFTNKQLSTPCASGEWTIKEILVHIIDDERIFAYRALRFARNDSTELPGFEQDDYVPQSRANKRDIEDILAEHGAVRQATIALFNSFDEDMLVRKGVGSGNALSVRAAAYHIAGHELHHIASIEENYV